jgi:hypothetical protein
MVQNVTPKWARILDAKQEQEENVLQDFALMPQQAQQQLMLAKHIKQVVSLLELAV